MSLRSFLDTFKSTVAQPTTTMTAQSPTGGTSSTVTAPTMTAAGPLLSPPTDAAIYQAPATAPQMPAAAPQPAPAAISPAPAPSVATQPTAAQAASMTASIPGNTAPASSAANLALTAPTAQQLTPPPAVTSTTGTGSGAIQSTTLNGTEGPRTINPTMSAALQQLLAQAQGAASRAVEQPTVWDDELAGQIKAQQKRGIDQNFMQEGDALDAELAGRGLNFSSIAGSRVTDLKTRKAQALSDVDTNIARERANALASGRASGLAGLQSILGITSGIETGQQNAARGERDYVDNTANTARNQALEEMVLGHTMSMQDQAAWQAAIQQGLNYGTNGAGTAALGTAGSINNATGAAYGGQADADNAQVQQLMQYAMQFFGGQ